MNRFIITARMAKGLTEKEVAGELEIDETLYKEIELGISTLNSEMAKAYNLSLLSVAHETNFLISSLGCNDNMQILRDLILNDYTQLL